MNDKSPLIKSQERGWHETMSLISRRPWQRTVIKLGASLLGQRYRHYHAWWPGLKLELQDGGPSGAVIFRGRQVARLSAFSMLHATAPQEITIVGSGPSIKRLDLRALEPYSAILLNGAAQLASEIRPLAVAVEDERFVWSHFPIIRDNADASTPLLLSVPVIRTICEIDASFLAKRTVILIEDLRKPYRRPRQTDEELAALPFVVFSENRRCAFSTDPEKGVIFANTVAFSAVQFALSVEPETIGFAGIDLSNGREPRFYETAGNAQPSSLVGSIENILGHINLAREWGEARGIIFRNYSEASALSTIGIGYDPRLVRTSA